ncbi:hypothetical protein VVR26_08175 [Corynebacterium camporealensis]|uniref:hypothetical protein n=1 Tax=Corynebacterium camporealensis TaxID=161896 RepID=UPI0034CEC99B
MKEHMPQRLASFSFIVCAIAMGISFALNGGSITGTKEWAMAIGIVILVSLTVALTVWTFSRMILVGKQPKNDNTVGD